MVLRSSSDPTCTGPSAQLWGSGFLPGRFQGVPLRGGKDPVAFLREPDAIARSTRRQQLDAFARLNELRRDEILDPEIATRTESYEMAFRMQASVPEVASWEDESDETLALYGAERGKPSYAANCLLARRLVERGTRFAQLYHDDWDHHYQLNANIKKLAGQTDLASSALVLDLKRRGLLDDTLVVWGGEFSRTPMNQGG